MYQRELAVAYANRWWNGRNPAFPAFAVDCTNFISQCLFAGGAPMNYTNSRTTGWWIEGGGGHYGMIPEHWSYSWSVAHSLHWHLRTAKSGLRGEQMPRAEDLLLGDVISYDWEGDGTFTHSTIVTARTDTGEPLVNAHTGNSFQRHWSYRDSPAWSARTRYVFFRIVT